MPKTGGLCPAPTRQPGPEPGVLTTWHPPTCKRASGRRSRSTPPATGPLAASGHGGRRPPVCEGALPLLAVTQNLECAKALPHRGFVTTDFMTVSHSPADNGPAVVPDPLEEPAVTAA